MKRRSALEALESAAFLFTTFLLVVLSAAIFAGVVTRYVLRISVPELALIQRFCVFWLIFTGGALAVRSGDHLSIDVFGPFLSERGLKVQRIAIDVLSSFAVVLFLFVGYNGFLSGLNRTELLRISWFGNARISLAVFNGAFLFGATLMFLFQLAGLIERYRFRGR
jgi:TRAP-type C4-dicarboxylate transport system permease small subunit